MFRVLGRYVFAATALLGLAEAVVVAAIIYAGAAIFSGYNLDLSPNLVLQAAFVALAVVLAMHTTGLYDEAALTNLRQSLIKLAFVIGPIFMMAVMTTGLLAKGNVVRIYPYRWQWTIGLTTLWFTSVLSVRLFFAHLQEQGRFTKRIVLLGDDRFFMRVRDLANAHGQSIRVVAQFDQAQIAATDEHVPFHLALLDTVKQSDVHQIVVDPSLLSKLSVADLMRLRASGYPIVGFTQWFERETRRVQLQSIEPQALLFSKGLKRSGLFEFVKRAMDIVAAIIGLVVFMPVMAIAALALRLEGSGPIFYRQERIGRNSKSFMILKFRSMRVDAEESGAPRWASESDPRITPVGRIIRKLRIDEFPQFLNVLRGDMSIVGPRPERPYFVSELTARLPFYDERHLVRPGITGWAQVHFRYGASFEDAARKHEYDLFYLKHRSIWLDLVVLLKTVRIVIFAEGAR